VTPFEYLSVLVSIIVGLGLSHLLTGAARLIQMRRRVRGYAPTYLWIGILLVVQIQIWWAAYEDRDEVRWTFFGFFSFLILPIVAALLSYLLVPDLEGEHHELDLRASFLENAAWFHGLLAAAAAVSLARDLLDDGRAALDLDALFRAGFLVQGLLAARIRSDAFQLINALVVLGLFLAYVATLFVQLG
jgi:hypothetical protein